MSETTTIDLLRHGEPVGGRRYRGQIDDPLSDTGWQEMRDAVSGQGPWQTIISSPLIRCAAFAAELSDQMDITLSYDDRLKEVGFGHWEGFSGDQLRAQDPHQMKRFYHDPIGHRPQNAEPLESFSQRVVQAYNQAVRENSGQHILLITHAGVIRSILANLLDAPLGSMYRFSIGTASLSRIKIGTERPPTIMFIGKQSLS
ncbi:MAG: histidine phosphatase family protein [Candidatus Thiodiazotropha lotti]|uniref:Histidine phosphatase family protein n=1 Tax=Candidatus Thiodiazotropha lotti TaxID=2792787 RepID=A0A9E4K6D6_9GAMM|nr:histidine phosphatase family protein [Candidatus Thiodiazotropha lotti]MCW4203758.1 histidine phosphatase family protein [Candidatus Thiodiazotropha lotti]